MQHIYVDLGKNNYPIHIESGSLSRIGNLLKSILPLSANVEIVTNNLIGHLYGNIVQDSLESNGIKSDIIKIPDGEEYKSLEWAGKVFDAFIEHQMNRNSAVIALGGGVIGDLAGFVAATFMRGISLIQVPTSLIAQVDSSVGGKTAVNHPKAKNLIGVFYQPTYVLIDIDVLKTLPEREFRSGLAEVVKHGVIMDKELFEYMEGNISKILALDPQSMEQIVARSCKDKVTIVEQDEKEQNIRAILNYGHTVGHGIESVTEYRMFRHGEAISIGMIVAGRIAVNRGILKEENLIRQSNLLKAYGLPVTFPDLDIDSIINAIYLDKKIKETGRLRFVLPKDIGEAIIMENIEEKEVIKAIEETKEK